MRPSTTSGSNWRPPAVSTIFAWPPARGQASARASSLPTRTPTNGWMRRRRILATQPDASLQARVDAFIDLIAAAQTADGYLFTYNQLHFPGQRWINLQIEHELYCLGHLIEAGIAHQQATGSQRLLAICTRAGRFAGARLHGRRAGRHRRPRGNRDRPAAPSPSDRCPGLSGTGAPAAGAARAHPRLWPAHCPGGSEQSVLRMRAAGPPAGGLHPKPS